MAGICASIAERSDLSEFIGFRCSFSSGIDFDSELKSGSGPVCQERGTKTKRELEFYRFVLVI